MTRRILHLSQELHIIDQPIAPSPLCHLNFVLQLKNPGLWILACISMQPTRFLISNLSHWLFLTVHLSFAGHILYISLTSISASHSVRGKITLPLPTSMSLSLNQRKRLNKAHNYWKEMFWPVIISQCGYDSSLQRQHSLITIIKNPLL